MCGIEMSKPRHLVDHDISSCSLRLFRCQLQIRRATRTGRMLWRLFYPRRRRQGWLRHARLSLHRTVSTHDVEATWHHAEECATHACLQPDCAYRAWATRLERGSRPPPSKRSGDRRRTPCKHLAVYTCASRAHDAVETCHACTAAYSLSIA
jgi:hypothetical protein